MQAASEGFIMVPIERFKALEALEAKQKQSLERLHQKEKENPKEHIQKVLERYYKNRDVINEKRRAAYKAKKEAEAASKPNAPSS
jgi:hypothetical protein